MRLITLAQNRGKTAALAEAIALAKGEYLLLVDADLIGLSPADITALIAPVLSGRAGLSISLRRNAPWVWRRIGLDYISGERFLPKALIEPRLAGITDFPKFGFEVLLNELCIAAARPVAVVLWPGVIQSDEGREISVGGAGLAGRHGVILAISSGPSRDPSVASDHRHAAAPAKVRRKHWMSVLAARQPRARIEKAGRRERLKISDGKASIDKAKAPRAAKSTIRVCRVGLINAADFPLKPGRSPNHPWPLTGPPYPRRPIARGLGQDLARLPSRRLQGRFPS